MLSGPNCSMIANAAPKIDGIQFWWFPLESFITSAENVEFMRSGRLEYQSIGLVLQDLSPNVHQL